MKKITLATVKSFIKREAKNNNLYLKKSSSFDGMVDCVMPIDDVFSLVNSSKVDFTDRYKLGIAGTWFVGDSRDYFEPFTIDNFTGYRVSNCCGDFYLAMKI